MTEETKWGRPRTWDDPEDMAEVVAQYFQDCRKDDEPPTQAGLALFLGFDSRQSLWEYGKTPRFTYIIKAAKTAIERHHERRLSDGASSGSIFWLKCHGGYQEQVAEAAPQRMEVVLVGEDDADDDGE